MSTLRRIAPWCFALALILYLKPYTGIRHDATLYLVQGLRIVSPDIFNKDLFFLAGSQADFTVFPRMLAFLLERASAGSAFLGLTFVGRLVFYAASWYLVRGLFPLQWQWAALFALIIMPTGYGAFSIFSYAESFLTSRPYAEALSLGGIGLLVRGRTFGAIVCLGLAGLLHPLQGFAGALVAWCWLAKHDRRWIYSLLLGIPLVFLGFVGVAPFGGIFTVIDPEWKGIIIGLSDQVFLSAWTPRDWCIVLTDFYLLHLLSKCSIPESRLAILCRSVMVALGIGLAFGALFSDVLQLMLPTGLQLWRVLWIVHWLAVASMPMLIGDHLKWHPKDRVGVLLIIAIAVIGASVPRSTLPWGVLGLIPLHMIWPHVRGSISSAVRYVVLVGIFAMLLIALLRYQIQAWLVFRMLGSNFEVVRQDVVVLAYPLVIGTIVAGIAHVYIRSGRLASSLWGGASVIALVCAIAFWDARSPWTQVQEGSSGTDVFGEAIPRESSVYWYEGEPSPLGPWLVLGRANYFSPYQLSGQMFNRGTSFAGIKLHAQVEPVSLQAEICQMMDSVNGTSNACWVGRAGLEYMCTPHGAVSPPDYFVLPFDQRELVRGKWVARHPGTGDVLLTNYLYKCSDWVSHSASQQAWWPLNGA